MSFFTISRFSQPLLPFLVHNRTNRHSFVEESMFLEPDPHFMGGILSILDLSSLIPISQDHP